MGIWFSNASPFSIKAFTLYRKQNIFNKGKKQLYASNMGDYKKSRVIHNATMNVKMK